MMATKKIGRNPAPTRRRPATSRAAPGAKPVALTVKVDNETYVRLCTFGATQRRTNQDILLEAVKQYLDRTKA